LVRMNHSQYCSLSSFLHFHKLHSRKLVHKSHNLYYSFDNSLLTRKHRFRRWQQKLEFLNKNSKLPLKGGVRK
jgi:hypothetical protein